MANENSCKIRCWSELVPDVLGLIFRHLSLEEILTVVLSVCKSWRNVVLWPYCWEEIDLLKWSSRCRGKPEKLHQMLEMLISRSCGTFCKLSTNNLPFDESFAIIANNARSLEMLRLPRGEMSDSIVEQYADRFPNSTFLDLGHRFYISAKALEAFGKHCKLLSTLKHRRKLSQEQRRLVCNHEALAIADTMLKLKHLEISFCLLSDLASREINSRCREFEDFCITDPIMPKLHDRNFRSF